MERYREVNDVLERALEKPSDEVDEFLDAACGDDTDLRRRVDRLLGRRSRLGEFLVQPIFSLRVPDPDEGRRVGPYLLGPPLGRGGMGAVYLGRRVEGGFDQDVAVKLLKRGLDTDEIVRRFRHERQVLARLSHENVARLLDGGALEDGRPYLVMEHVEGAPLDDYCAAHRLDVRERLRLFLQVCAAVAFAHRNLIVHRDLKPENVLVTDDGTPKLLDFGIAKLLEDDPRFTRAATELAAGSFGPGTLCYASPEQLRGDVVSTATDVYSLGVVLFELLTGGRPYDLDGLSITEAVGVVERQIPPLVSAAVHASAVDEGPKLRRALQGDLDAIVEKALAKEPDERFRSVEELAEEVERYLDGRPVKTRKASVAYRTWKFVRRNAVAVSTAAAFLLLVLGFAATMTFQRLEIAEQRDEIEARNVELVHEKERVENVLGLLVDTLGASDPSRAKGKDVTVQKALTEGIRQLDGSLQGDPDIHAQILDAAGRIFRSLGAYGDATRSLEKAVELARQAYGQEDPELAKVLISLANVELDRRALDRAEELFREAIRIQRRAYPGGHPDLARGLGNLASLLLDKRELDEAETLAREALAMQRTLLGNEHEDVARTLNVLATVLRRKGKIGEAEVLYRECLVLRRPSDDPAELATVLSNLAALLADRAKDGDLQEARTFHEEALALRRQIYDGDHRKLLASLNNLGVLLVSLGEAEEARKLLGEALDIVRRLYGGQSETAMKIQKNLASALLALGEHTACEKLVRETLDFLRSEDSRAEAESVLGGCLAGQGRDAEAKPLLVGAAEKLSPGRAAREAQRRLETFLEARERHEER